MKKRLLCIALSLMLLISAITLRITLNYSEAFDQFSETVVKSNIKIRINQIISENINSRNIQFNEISIVNRASDGRIISISINSALINTILLKIEEEILKEFENCSMSVGMPIGNLFGIKFLSGVGPKINVKVLPVLVTAYEPKSELISSGINQSLHRITTVFEAEARCVAPFYNTNCHVKTTVILSEILIVGEIPEIIVSPVG